VIPLLLYRISPPSLKLLSSKIPFAHLLLLDITPFTTGCVSGEDKAHLTTSRLLMPPLYQKLEVDTLYAYLCLLTLPLNATPIFILDPYEKRAANSQHWNVANVLDSDSDCLVGIHARE
jgi:hypothetical protein